MTTYRARRRSSAWEIMNKMEQRYDAEDSEGTVEQIARWINLVLENKHDPFKFEPGEGISWKNFKKFLRDGIALCKLMNELLLSENLEPLKYHTTKINEPFRCLENIELFTKGAMEYGVPETSMFATADLYEGQKGPFVEVLNCLNELGVLANSKNFEPRYELITPTRDVDMVARLNALYQCTINPGGE